jgi:hypothetical protein
MPPRSCAPRRGDASEAAWQQRVHVPGAHEARGWHAPRCSSWQWGEGCGRGLWVLLHRRAAPLNRLLDKLRGARAAALFARHEPPTTSPRNISFRARRPAKHSPGPVCCSGAPGELRRGSARRNPRRRGEKAARGAQNSQQRQEPPEIRGSADHPPLQSDVSAFRGRSGPPGRHGTLISVTQFQFKLLRALSPCLAATLPAPADRCESAGFSGA